MMKNTGNLTKIIALTLTGYHICIYNYIHIYVYYIYINIYVYLYIICIYVYVIYKYTSYITIIMM